MSLLEKEEHGAPTRHSRSGIDGVSRFSTKLLKRKHSETLGEVYFLLACKYICRVF